MRTGVQTELNYLVFLDFKCFLWRISLIFAIDVQKIIISIQYSVSMCLFLTYYAYFLE